MHFEREIERGFMRKKDRKRKTYQSLAQQNALRNANSVRHSARLGSIWVARNLYYRKWQICIENKKIKKLKKSNAEKVILENTDFFFKKAKFAFGLAICYFLFKK